MPDRSFGVARRRECIGGHLAVLGLVSMLVVTASATMAAAVVPSPTVEGPITGGSGTPFVAATSFDLAQVGYMQQEYFISGTASAYTSTDTFKSDGKWTAAPASSAPYKTRILVYLPTKPNKFKGTVVVEWLNVTAGLDAGPDWALTHTELIRDGYAWVGVSAQAVGVEGGTTIFGTPSVAPLKTVDPVRYGSLSHPGDSFSYDIFSQAGEALRHPTGVSPLGAVKLKTVLATGDSQSAFRLVTYINAIHQSAGVYDGFLVHSRGDIGAALSQAPQPAISVLGSAPIRSDLDVPVLIFETETDLVRLNYFAARQADSTMVRVWEVAGTAHADAYSLDVGVTDAGKAAVDTTYSPPVQSIAGGFITCDLPINQGPQHYVESAAIWALNRWVQKGTPPKQASPRLDVAAGSPPVITRDANGNAVGGIRTPQEDVPIATLSGGGQSGSFCSLFGTTVPFDSATLTSLYPKHSKYVSAVKKAKNAAVKAGFILKVDAAEIATAAAKSSIGN
jgi:alpha/beta hydrolase family protein